MPKGPKGEKRPADVIGNAVKLMRIATGEETEEPETDRAKSAAARSTKIEEPVVASADQRERRRRGGVVGRRSTSGGFFSGLILGLGAASLVNSVQTETPRYPSRGLGDDWFAVGDDLRSAMRRVNGKEE
jgi:hypothetical protein